MRIWLVAALVVAWTSAVAFYADRHGYARAERACQLERDQAELRKQGVEANHAAAAQKFEEDRKHAREQIEDLEDQLAQAGRDSPVPADCRLDARRVRIWNAANAGAPVSGEPAGAVRSDVPTAPVR